MNNWQETCRVFEELAGRAGEGRASALAVIVRLEGSAYRLPGAKVLVRDDGTMIGNVSGGCLEGDVREHALKVMQGAGSKRLHYDTSLDADQVWGLGVGCGGKVDLLVLSSAVRGLSDVRGKVLEFLRGDRPFAIATVLEGDGAGRMVVADADGTIADGTTGDQRRDELIARAAKKALSEGSSVSVETGGVPVFIEVLAPPPDLVVIGAADDSIPLVQLAAQVGFRVTVVDHRPAFAQAGRFPAAHRVVVARPEEAPVGVPAGSATFAVVKSHVLAQDRAWTERFAASGVRYLGLLGSGSRRQSIMSSLTGEQRGRVYGPVGLDLGAEGPDQMAVSIVAELLAVAAGRSPGHLRDRGRPIHA